MQTGDVLVLGVKVQDSGPGGLRDSQPGEHVGDAVRVHQAAGQPGQRPGGDLRPIQSGAAQALLARAREEGEQVLTAAGIDHAGPDEDAEVRTRLNIAKIPGQPRGGGSTWQSLTRGTGSVEADYLAGEVVLLGRLHVVATPVNAALCAIADDFAARGVRPGSMTADELTAIIDG